MLTLENVSYSYTGRSSRVDVLHGVTCTFEQGKFYTIQGPSGCGKSTMLSLMAALDHPQEGRILYDGTPLKEIKTARYRHSCVTTIFQRFNLLTYATVIENVMYPQLLNGVKAAEARKAAAELLAKVDIAESLHKRLPRNLSGGEQQRVAIARALAAGAKVILADEPTGNLDEENSRRVVAILKQLVREKDGQPGSGKTIIMVTHDGDLAKEADVMYSLRGGMLRVVEA
ncbi:MAG: ABC transporter ATP-binding protein [Clostridia bacterium]|nr:ABC transporter ATP-binding protein [Clostridia bacterium]